MHLVFLHEKDRMKNIYLGLSVEPRAAIGFHVDGTRG